MRNRFLLGLSVVLSLFVARMAVAELKDVTVGGQVWIMGNYFQDPSFDNNLPNDSFVEQRTRFQLKANFTDDVSAFIQLQDYSYWGEDFESTTSTSLGGFEVNEFGNARNDTGDVELEQAYIQADKLWGTAFGVRVGRQQLRYGREFLVGGHDNGSFFFDISFDAAKAWYHSDKVDVDVWWSKLGEFRFLEEDADTDFYGVYSTFRPWEPLSFDLYWLYVRDAGDKLGANTNLLFGSFPGDDTDELHTVGARAFGTYAGWDYNAEAAFQFGDAEIGFPHGNYEGYTFDVLGGYTFQNWPWAPRFGAEYVYFSGDDNLLDKNVKAFNRVFSNVEYGAFFGSGEQSNSYTLVLSAAAHPTEKIDLGLDTYLYWTAEDEVIIPPRTLFEALTVGHSKLESNDYVATEVDLYGTYHYSEDLSILLGYTHYFTGGGVEDGALILGNGITPVGTSGKDDDTDYLYFKVALEF